MGTPDFGDGADALVDRDELILVDRLWRSGSTTAATSPSTRADARLLHRFRTMGDRSLAVPLLRRHRLATWRIAAVVTLDLRTAAEVVDRTWHDVLDPGDELAVPVPADGTWTNPRAWMFCLVRHHAAELGLAPGTELDLDTDVNGVPLDQTGDVGLLAASYALLDEPARTALWLRVVEGFDDDDAALVLDVEPPGVEPLVERALDELRRSALDAQLRAAPPRCRPTLERFPGYLDGGLDDADTRLLLSHLSRCRRCAARLDAVEAPGPSLVDRILVPPAELTADLRRLASGRAHAAV